MLRDRARRRAAERQLGIRKRFFVLRKFIPGQEKPVWFLALVFGFLAIFVLLLMIAIARFFPLALLCVVYLFAHLGGIMALYVIALSDPIANPFPWVAGILLVQALLSPLLARLFLHIHLHHSDWVVPVPAQGYSSELLEDPAVQSILRHVATKLPRNQRSS